MNAHVDVAAYALGALSDRESAQFEDHLVTCSTCVSELESMVSIVTLMSDVTLADITDDNPRVGPYTAATGIPTVGRPAAPPPGPPLTAPVGPVSPAFPDPVPVPNVDPRRDEPRVVRRDERRDDRREERRDDRREERRPAASAAPVPAPTPISRGRSRGRRGVLLAAAAAVVGAVGGGAVVAETGYFDQPQSSVEAQDGAVPLTGEKVSATDRKTGAHIEAALDSKAWGTKVSFAVTKVDGPQSCRLVAVRRNGDTEVLSTWTVPDGGYGYDVRPQPLSLSAATALRSKDLTHLQVQAMDGNGDPSTLVTVRV
jgi:hypothetical protein